MIPPTKQQALVLRTIRDLTKDGVPPSYQELADAIGKGKPRIHYLLTRMKDRGLVDFEYGRSRSLRIIEPIERIDLRSMSTAELSRLRARIEATMINRWNP